MLILSLSVSSQFRSVWEQQWVLPTPTARIKIKKWVKTSRSREFPGTEDARFVYPSATTTSAPTAIPSNAPGQAAVQQQPAPSSATDALMTEAVGSQGILAASAGEGTQGGHLFDETQVEVSAAATPMDVEMDDSAAATKTAPTPSGANTPAPVAPLPASAMADETMAEEEEGGGAVEFIPKNEVLRIGGPLPPSAAVPAAAAAPAEVPSAAAAETTEDPAQVQETMLAAVVGLKSGDSPEVPVPQVESELHPPPDGLPVVTAASPTLAPSGSGQGLLPTGSAPEAASSDLSSIPSASQPVPQPDPLAPVDSQIERNPSIAVDVDQDADALGGSVTVVGRDDPEVQGLGEDVAAVVHDQPDGVEQIKVVVDDPEKEGQ